MRRGTMCDRHLISALVLSPRYILRVEAVLR